MLAAAGSPRPALAGVYVGERWLFGVADTWAAIGYAVDLYSVDVTCVVRAETGGTFEPNVEGDGGHSFGAAQFYDRGMLWEFLAEYGVENGGAYNPYYALDKMARAIREGRGAQWTPILLGLCP